MSHESTNQTQQHATGTPEASSPPERIPERIIVALDASPQSLAALRAAAQLAAAMQVELHAIFIEDDRLLRLCNSPFSREVGRYTAAVRPLESLSIERAMRVMASGLRRTVARVAAEVQVHWTFQVRRGGIEQELLQAAADALLLSVGRAGWLDRRGLGSTATVLIRQTMRPLLLLGEREEMRYPLTLVYDGTPNAERALQLAVRLAQRDDHLLQVLLVAPPNSAADLQERLALYLRNLGIQSFFTTIASTEKSTAQTATFLRAIHNQSVILPAEYAPLLAELQGPVFLVP
jgi:nucleotide-binding universal stress UspA family protein